MCPPQRDVREAQRLEQQRALSTPVLHFALWKLRITGVRWFNLIGSSAAIMRFAESFQ